MRIVIDAKDKAKNSRIAEYVELKKRIEDQQNRLKELEEQIINTMTDEQRKSMSYNDGGKRYRLTFVQSHSVVIDEPGLKKALSAPVFNKLTTAKLDRKKLEAAMEAGTVDAVIVAQHSQDKASRPYLRFSEGVASDEKPS